MNSKMLGWIKKQCRRRSDPSGGRDKYYEELTQVKSIVSDCPVYFTIDVTCPSSNNNDRNIDDHVYEEIDVTETCTSYDMIKEITNLKKKMEDEFGCKENVCPLCRSKIEQLCACVDFESYDKATAIHEPRIYELAQNTFSQKERRSSRGYPGANRPLPNLPCESLIKPETMSGDDSSGFYESIGSESDGSSDNQDYCYNDNSLHVHEKCFLAVNDDANDYEEIDIKHTITQRRHSLNSYPVFKSPGTLLQNTVKGKEPCLSTINRRGSSIKQQKKKSRLSLLTLRKLIV